MDTKSDNKSALVKYRERLAYDKEWARKCRRSIRENKLESSIECAENSLSDALGCIKLLEELISGLENS